jgi:hypothetical protein
MPAGTSTFLCVSTRNGSPQTPVAAGGAGIADSIPGLLVKNGRRRCWSLPGRPLRGWAGGGGRIRGAGGFYTPTSMARPRRKGRFAVGRELGGGWSLRSPVVGGWLCWVGSSWRCGGDRRLETWIARGCYRGILIAIERLRWRKRIGEVLNGGIGRVPPHSDRREERKSGYPRNDEHEVEPLAVGGTACLASEGRYDGTRHRAQGAGFGRGDKCPGCRGTRTEVLGAVARAAADVALPVGYQSQGERRNVSLSEAQLGSRGTELVDVTIGAGWRACPAREDGPAGC